jgi:hypothetical protein
MRALPNEILTNVLQRLSFNDQINCQYVSKVWRKVSLSCFEGIVVLRNDDVVNKFSTTLNNADIYGTEYKGFGASVKKLIVSGEGKLDDSQGKFVDLLGKIPNLEEMELCSNPTNYLAFMDQSDIVFDNLHFIKINKNFMHLVTATYISLMNKHVNSIKRFRMRVRHDGTSNYDSRDFLGGPVGDRVGVYLGQFSRLTNYSVMISEPINLLPIMENCPGLTHLTIKGSHPHFIRKS